MDSKSSRTSTMLAKAVILITGLQTVLCQINQDELTSVPCYEFGLAQRCQPPFENAAYGSEIEATNTCGMNGETEYCLQTGKTGARKYCDRCDNNIPSKRHPPEFLTDFNNSTRWTWWQSETMLEGVQYPTVVNLTVHLKKSFDIAYVNLRFFSPRPESFAIFKRASEDGEWEPFQYYSLSCEKTYGLSRYSIITKDNEDQAICSKDYSKISPLTGGTVAFSTLEGRPDMNDFLNSPTLQQWVTATDIRIVLTRMNTFGDEVFGDPQVLKSYFYAISDLAIGARCKCNGHASRCVSVRDRNNEARLQCQCEHNTMGVDCEKCLPFYNDQPWSRSTKDSAHECQPCDCNGMSDTCEFEAELYRLTGHGGRCTNCRDNTAGIHCEECRENYWRRGSQCVNCGCNPTGSVTQQCDSSGQCRCKPGVGGERCDRCLPNFYEFSEEGCVACECSVEGSLNNEPRCDTSTGECRCKEYVDGRRCDKCKTGYFGLDENNPFGCIACFCYGQSSECSSAGGFYARNITTDFATGNQRWTAVTRGNQEIETQYNGITQSLGVKADSSEPLYFLAPARYLGDQRYSYNQFLTFDLRIAGNESARPSRMDVVLEGGSGDRTSIHIFAQGNQMPSTETNSFAFRIHEHQNYQWSPRVSAVDIISVLSNLTALKIRATYTDGGVGFIDNINLGSASQGAVPGQPEAPWVERCVCPEGYIGQFCESCRQGYKRDPPNSGPFSRCVPCQCNGHSSSCDISTGRCICQDNTAGDYCQRCARGYYGDATNGTPDDCKACPCPDGGPCIETPNGEIVCTECAEGTSGNLCEKCTDSFYGDPNGAVTGIPTPCTKCGCNGNIDPNAVGNCDTVTGECLRCIRNTDGPQCERCLDNYYNNTNGECTACNCYHHGTQSQPGTSGCDQRTGQCLCLPNVIGRQCEDCASGYWDLASGEGCKPCECDQTGSLNYTCDLITGQCQCKQGVTGRRCDTCDAYYYGFSDMGCTACNCDPIGSTDLNCDDNGYCNCRENVAGRHCDRCQENKYDISAGCLDCPQCYNLVQDQVNNHRAKLRELTILIEKTNDNPSLFNDTKFVTYLESVNDSVNALLEDARGAYTGDGKVGQELDMLRQTLNELMDKLVVIAANIDKADQASKDTESDIKLAEDALTAAERAYQKAKDYLDKEGMMALNQALEALKNFGQGSKQMTEIAKQATTLAEKHTKDAEAIEMTAKLALETSEEARRLAQEALRMPDSTRDEIDRLRRDLDDASRLYEDTKAHAQASNARAQQAFNEAIQLTLEADKQLPTLNMDELRGQADAVNKKAEEIKQRAADLAQSNEELMEQVRNQTQAAEDLLSEGDLLNVNITELLAEADYARDVARKAVETAEKMIQEANDTLRTLEDFDQLVNKKDAAEAAMDQVPEIQQIIEEARNTSQMAREALSGVVADAKRALQLAEEAEAIAKQASEEANKIRREAEETKTKAEMLKDDAMTLDQEVKMADMTLDNFEQQVQEDESDAKQALQAAAAARSKAKDAYDEVSRSHSLVETIKASLQQMGTVDMDQLKQLEELLDKVEQEMKDSDVANKLKELQDRKSQIESQADAFDQDLSELYKDVANIREIKDSLPDGCFKTIPIEFKPV